MSSTRKEELPDENQSPALRVCHPPGGSSSPQDHQDHVGLGYRKNPPSLCAAVLLKTSEPFVSYQLLHRGGGGEGVNHIKGHYPRGSADVVLAPVALDGSGSIDVL